MNFDYKKYVLKAEFRTKNNSKDTIFNISGKYFKKFSTFYTNCNGCVLNKIDENSYQLNHSNLIENSRFTVEFTFVNDEFDE